MLLFFVHEAEGNKERRVKEPNRNCARNAFRFSSGAATVPSTVIHLTLADKFVLVFTLPVSALIRR
jgi:hypothetical protein